MVAAYPPHTLINMPALSPTMTAGSIGTWQKKAGDVLQPGDVLVEIETDKAQMDFEFQEEGVLAKILKDSGERDIAVGKVSLNHSPALFCLPISMLAIFVPRWRWLMGFLGFFLANRSLGRG